MKKWSLLIWALLFININSNAQIFSQAYNSLEKNHSFLELKKSTDSLIQLSKLKQDTSSLRRITHKFAIKCYKKGLFVDAIYYEKAHLQSFQNKELKAYTNALYNLGRFSYLNFEYDIAINYYKKVIELNNYPHKIAQSYCELGRCYDKKGDFFKSISFFEKGIKLLKSQKENKSLFSQYINIAKVYKKSKTNGGLDALKKAEEISEKMKFKKSSIYNLNLAFANHYTTEPNYNFKKAKHYYFKNLKELKKANDSFRLAVIYNNISNLYTEKKSDSALIFIEKGLLYSKNSFLKMKLYLSQGEYYLQINNNEGAIKSFYKSLILNKYSPNKFNPSEISNKKNVTYALSKQSEALIKIYKESKDETLLKKTIKNIKHLDKLVDFINNDVYQEESKLLWREEASNAYVKGAYSAILLGNKDLAFYYTEKNKALLLTEEIIKNSKQSGLPKNVSDKVVQFKRQIFSLKNQSFNYQNETLKSQKRDSLFIIKQQLQKFNDSIKNTYPEFFKSQIVIDQVSLKKTRERLQDETVILSYIWNKIDENNEAILGLTISKDTVISFKINSVKETGSLLKKYKEYISKPLETNEELQAFQRNSFKLYQTLLPTTEIKNLILGKDLLIIPDGDLQNIPFEALITKEKSNAYLINTTNVSYAYSISFLEYNKKLQRRTSTNFIGYAPIKFSGDTLINLDNTEKELDLIKKYLKGDFYFNNRASKGHFLTESGKSKIIHLATHANAVNSPWIAFSDAKLELYELYTYKNNAEIVTLSACETSLGKEVKGEGVLSLARGFFYSGAKSVVSSLWSVNDKSTSFIMEDFYKNLKDGETKSIALGNAKRNYLNNHSLYEQSPYHWASFILIGENNTIDFHSTNNSIIIYALMALLCILFIIYLIKTKRYQ